MYVPSAVTKQAEIEAAIAHVQQSIGPDVVRIRYEIGEDWKGEWAIFFRIVSRMMLHGTASVRWRPRSNGGWINNWISPAWACFRTTISAVRPSRRCCRNPLGPSGRAPRRRTFSGRQGDRGSTSDAHAALDLNRSFFSAPEGSWKGRLRWRLEAGRNGRGKRDPAGGGRVYDVAQDQRRGYRTSPPAFDVRRKTGLNRLRRHLPAVPQDLLFVRRSDPELPQMMVEMFVHQDGPLLRRQLSEECMWIRRAPGRAARGEFVNQPG